MSFPVKTRFCEDECVLEIGRYESNDHIALSLFSLEDGPFADITVNLRETTLYPENFAFVDVNNFPEAEKLIETLGIGEKTDLDATSGFCFYPLYRFDVDKCKEYTD